LGGGTLLSKLLFLLFITCSLLCPAPGKADNGASIYTPNYKYTGSKSQTIGAEEAEGKDPLLATVFSILPGVVFHGFGNFYAGDYDFGTRLLVAELLGTGISMWGYNVIHESANWTPYFGDNSQQAGYWIKAIGVALICASWVGDIATAGEAAQSYNKDHQIQFQLESRYDGAQLALIGHF
jgi:hypothetical protein